MVKSVCLPVCFLIYYNLSYREKYKMERKELLISQHNNALHERSYPVH